jgi:hypothetical protein
VFGLKVISSTGVKWQTRFAVLTNAHLAFTKRYDLNELVSGLASVPTERLRKAFDKFDTDKNGSGTP